MKSIRLNEMLRQEICNNALNHVFKKRDEEIKKKEETLAIQTYLAMYSKEEIELMGNAPKKAFRRENYIYVNYNGRRKCLDFKKEMPHFYDHESKTKFPSDHQLTKFFEELEEQKDSLKRDRRELSLKIKSTLNSVNTTNQLLEIWPEAKEYIPAQKEKVLLPAIINLNSEIEKIYAKYNK